MIVVTAAMAAFFAYLHLVAGRLFPARADGKSAWLSLAGGASTAYVFLYVLPGLCAGQSLINNLHHPLLSYLNNHVYLAALFGLLLFYGLERLAIVARRFRDGKTIGHDSLVFWLHLVSYALFAALTGYLLTRREFPGPMNLFFFFTAMALHMAVCDYGLLRHFRESYLALGRFVLAAAALLGWCLGALTRTHEAVLATLFAFLAGGVIMNAMKEEIPEERAVNFMAFLVGAAGYSVLLLTL